ncbi:hypothetical protein JN06_02728 [Bacteroides zoogleoformans]|nr:hypothetical protein JN06_02728 [Bacteroides zoogleoformans]
MCLMKLWFYNGVRMLTANTFADNLNLLPKNPVMHLTWFTSENVWVRKVWK